MNTYWTTPLYSCTQDTPQCIDTLLCCPCELSRQAMALRGIPNTYHAVTLLAAPFFFLCINFAFRRKVIDKYLIDEGSCTSAVTVLCAGSCSQCQVHRELTARNVWPGGTLPCLHDAPRDYRMMF